MLIGATFRFFNNTDYRIKISFKTNSYENIISGWYGSRELDAISGGAHDMWRQEAEGKYLKAIKVEVHSKISGHYIVALERSDLEIDQHEFNIELSVPENDLENNTKIHIHLKTKDGQTDIVGPLIDIA